MINIIYMVTMDKIEQVKSLLTNGRIPTQRTHKRYLEKVGLYDFIISYGEGFDLSFHKISDIIYAIVNDEIRAPICPICSKAMIRSNKKYCSRTCAGKDPNFKLRFEKVDKESSKLKRTATMIEKYGVAYNSQRSEIKTSNSEKSARRYLSDKVYELLSDRSWLENEYVIKGRTGVDIASELNCYYGTVLEYCRRHEFDIRTHYNSSMGEIEVAEFVSSLTDVNINNRKIISKELDIVTDKLAIEYNGNFWHSYNKHDVNNKNRHLLKTELCENVGLQLLHIFSDEWENTTKREIWKSIITHKLGFTPNKIYARDCLMKNIKPSEARTFYEENHLHGFAGGSHIALTYNNEIVACITYGKSRFEVGSEIIRISFKKFTHVVGGLSKLLNQLPVGEYYTYGDRRFSTNQSYGNMFELIKCTEPNYWWTDGTLRISRYTTQPKKLAEYLGDKYDESLTEAANMFQAGYRIIYDSGNWKFKFVRR